MDTNLPGPGPRLPRQRSARITFITLAIAAALAACGGNGADDGTPTDQQAEGHAADAATMPLAAGTALGAATVTLQSALANAGAVAAAKDGSTDDVVGPLATGPVTSLPCARGGSVSWVASGPPLALLINGRLDAGESFEVTYTSCRTALTGVELDGRLTIVVDAADASGFDLTTTATALSSTTAHGRYVLDGTWRHQLAVTPTAGGGTQRVDRLATTRSTLVATVGLRPSRFELRDMDWTVTDQWNAAGGPVSSAHHGTLELFASTPRRPAATLRVATIGTLVIGADGLAASGGFSIVAGGNKWSVTYGVTTVTIELDVGNNGSVERAWTLPRLTFHGQAG